VIIKATGLRAVSSHKKGAGIIMGLIAANLLVQVRKSSEIFYLIPPLANSALED
jgi:hypothetical protein